MSCRMVGSTARSATKSAGAGESAPATPGRSTAVAMRPHTRAARLSMHPRYGLRKMTGPACRRDARGPRTRSAAERVDHVHAGLDLRAAVGLVVAGVQVAPPVPAAVGVAARLGDGLRVEHDHVVRVAVLVQ